MSYHIDISITEGTRFATTCHIWIEISYRATIRFLLLSSSNKTNTPERLYDGIFLVQYISWWPFTITAFDSDDEIRMRMKENCGIDEAFWFFITIQFSKRNTILKINVLNYPPSVSQSRKLSLWNYWSLPFFFSRITCPDSEIGPSTR
jgi:hypothetical protein